MFTNWHFFFDWWNLFCEIVVYSIATSLVLLLFFSLLVIATRIFLPVEIQRNYRATVVLFGILAVFVGLFAFLLGIMSSLSRSVGNPAIISAIIPAFAAAIFYFKEKSITIMASYVLLSTVFVVNIFSGVYFGSALRFQATESIGALRSQAVREFKIRQFRKNLDLPVKRNNSADK